MRRYGRLPSSCLRSCRPARELLRRQDYLELRALFENSLKLFVAVDEATPDNLRPVMSKRKALALIDSIVDADTIDENASPDAPTPTPLERRMKEEYRQAPQDVRARGSAKSIAVRPRAQRAARRFEAAASPHGQEVLRPEGLLCDELAVSLAVPREREGRARRTREVAEALRR